MEFNKWSIELEKRDDDIHVRPTGDTHAGNQAFAKNEFEKHINTVAKTPGMNPI